MKTDTSIHIYNPKNNFKEDCSTQSGTIPEDFKKNYEGSLCILENGNLLSFYCTDVISIQLLITQLQKFIQYQYLLI